jgi:hypothetical protein
MATRWARFARGWIAAIVATLVAALFHVASGGEAPAALGVLLALAFSGVACVLLAGTRLSLWRLSLSVTLSQFLFHALFGLGGASAGAHGTPGAHAHHLTHIDVGTLTGGAAHQHALLTAGPLMWAGHAAAALVTVILLRQGERRFWALCDRAAVCVVRCLAAPSPVPLDVAAARPVVEHVHLMLDLHVLLGRMRRRGPPALLAP